MQQIPTQGLKFYGVAIAVLVLGFVGIIWAIKARVLRGREPRDAETGVEIDRFDFGDDSWLMVWQRKQLRLPTRVMAI